MHLFWVKTLYLFLGNESTLFFFVWISSFPAAFVEGTAFSRLKSLGILPKTIDQYVWEFILWTLFCNQLVFMPTPHCFEYYRFVWVLKSGSVTPSALFFLFQYWKKEEFILPFSVFSVLTIWDSLRFCINFRKGFSIPAKEK